MTISTRRNQAGFTLTSTVIAVTVFGILAGATVPRLVQRKSTRNERTVMATMTAIADAEQQFHRLAFLDVDLDGRAEFATLGELTGRDELRLDRTRIEPPLLRIQFQYGGSIGLAERNGYYFALFLPNAMGQGDIDTTSADANLTCHYWSCLAWPKQRGITGVHSYFVNQPARSCTAPMRRTRGPRRCRPRARHCSASIRSASTATRSPTARVPTATTGCRRTECPEDAGAAHGARRQKHEPDNLTSAPAQAASSAASVAAVAGSPRRRWHSARPCSDQPLPGCRSRSSWYTACAASTSPASSSSAPSVWRTGIIQPDGSS